MPTGNAHTLPTDLGPCVVSEHCTDSHDSGTSVKEVMASMHDSPGWAEGVASDNVFMASAFNLVLAYSTDGVNPFKKSLHTMWPLIFKILNLEADKASRTDLLVLAGVIHGPRMPKSLQAYQLMVTDDALDLSIGVQTKSPLDGSVATIRAKIVCVLCDYPGHSKVSNQQDVGAKWGCLKCLLRQHT